MFYFILVTFNLMMICVCGCICNIFFYSALGTVQIELNLVMGVQFKHIQELLYTKANQTRMIYMKDKRISSYHLLAILLNWWFGVRSQFNVVSFLLFLLSCSTWITWKEKITTNITKPNHQNGNWLAKIKNKSFPFHILMLSLATPAKQCAIIWNINRKPHHVQPKYKSCWVPS